MTPEVVHPLLKKARQSKVPIAELIGFSVGNVAGDRAVASFRSGPQHSNPLATLHSGVLCDLADAAMGMAFVSTLARDESFTNDGVNHQFFSVLSGTRSSARKRAS